MHNRTTIAAAVAALLALGLGAGSAQALDFGDMMNPSKWFGTDKDEPPRPQPMPPQLYPST
ncbi:MAG: hypothetical protein PVJ30_07830, partial [Thiohalocapsa sp.]